DLSAWSRVCASKSQPNIGDFHSSCRSCTTALITSASSIWFGTAGQYRKDTWLTGSAGFGIASGYLSRCSPTPIIKILTQSRSRESTGTSFRISFDVWNEARRVCYVLARSYQLLLLLTLLVS